MIQKMELVQFYLDQYERIGKRKTARQLRFPDFNGKVVRLRRALKSARPARLSSISLEEFHRQLKNIACFAYRRGRTDVIRILTEEMIPRLVTLDYEFLLPEQRERLDHDFVAFAADKLSGQICTKSLFDLYPVYSRYVIQNKIHELVPLRPEMEFPETLQMNRRFILHIGPTNSGAERRFVHWNG